jgi:hypothetical protein
MKETMFQYRGRDLEAKPHSCAVNCQQLKTQAHVLHGAALSTRASVLTCVFHCERDNTLCRIRMEKKSKYSKNEQEW